MRPSEELMTTRPFAEGFTQSADLWGGGGGGGGGINLALDVVLY